MTILFIGGIKHYVTLCHSICDQKKVGAHMVNIVCLFHLLIQFTGIKQLAPNDICCVLLSASVCRVI
jgi:hypothetical protein